MARRQTVSAATRAEVIEQYGNRCWLGLPGCTGDGEEDDHIVPWSHRGRDSVQNLRRACKRCNASRQDRVLSGYGAVMHAVIGPPSADLYGAVEPLIGRSAITVMHSDFMYAMRPGVAEDEQTAAVRSAAATAWDAAYRRLSREREPVDVWLFRSLPVSHAHPHMLDEWIALDYDIHVVDPGAANVFDAVAGDVTAETLARKWYGLRITQQIVNARLAERHRRLVELKLRAEATATPRYAW